MALPDRVVTGCGLDWLIHGDSPRRRASADGEEARIEGCSGEDDEKMTSSGWGGDDLCRDLGCEEGLALDTGRQRTGRRPRAVSCRRRVKHQGQQSSHRVWPKQRPRRVQSAWNSLLGTKGKTWKKQRSSWVFVLLGLSLRSFGEASDKVRAGLWEDRPSLCGRGQASRGPRVLTSAWRCGARASAGG